MINTLTLETLIAKGACSEAKEKFAKIFPNGALVAVATFTNVAREFNWDCAAQLLLSPRNRVKFKKLAADASSTACANYDAAYATYNAAYATYIAARDAAHDAAYAAALVIYNACDAALDASCDASCDARDVAFATAFATLYIQQESKKS